METHISFDDLMAMEKRQRTNLVNSTGGFKSVCLIGTKDKQNKSNLAVFNSVIHIGATPPLIAFIVRPDSVDRHTLSNILETGYYSINHLNEKIYKNGHQTSARYPKEISEFAAVGLTETYKDSFFAPYVKESNVQLGIQFKERLDLTINGTILIIGQIDHLYFPKNCLYDDAFLDLEKANTITCSGLDSYHKTQRLERLSYAKPDKELETIKTKQGD
ncbi:MAG: flavin reductase [Bacteroidota bacterium]|nr:flavin reductase [Bacteroidota bacterium]